MTTKKDLCDHIFNKDRAEEFLYCPMCGNEYSASSGDYWNLPDDYVFKCECGEEMKLAEKTINIIYKQNDK